jgi:hypothetical protein
MDVREGRREERRRGGCGWWSVQRKQRGCEDERGYI